MKILHIVPGIDDPTCGIAVAARIVAQRQTKAGNAVVSVGYKNWSRASIRDADEVWVHSMWTPGVMAAAIYALAKGKQLVRMPHGCMDPVKVAHHRWKKMLVAPLERFIFRRAHRVIATDKAEESWIKSFIGRSCPHIDSLSLAAGRRVRMHDNCNNEISTREWKERQLNVLYVGRLNVLKGIRYLMEALPGQAKLVVIGKDEGELKVCCQIAQRRKLNVDFRGVVSEDEKEKAYQWCDVLVLPTLSDNFGLVIAEAFERGKRVITTDGAPAWGDGLTGLTGLTGLHSGYDGRLIYLKGYRDGTDEERVELLKKAICSCAE